MTSIEKAYSLLREWKGDRYDFGVGVLDRVGTVVSGYGKRVLVVTMNDTYLKPVNQKVIGSLKAAGCDIVPDHPVKGARPNAPREDVYRIETCILHFCPDAVVAIGGGSTIDACKAAIVLASLGECVDPQIDHYFGTGIVSAELEKTGKKLIPLIAVETTSSSGAHLTKYSNITDPVEGQKLLIVDNAVVPDAAVFDYSTTLTMPAGVTVDGALDAIAHTFEVFCGAKPSYYGLAEELAETALDLVFTYTRRAVDDPSDLEAREALGLATDLGGYAIMVGGTSGGHLTSFSLVDLVAHGTACGIMNPYYAVFYSPAIQDQLETVGNVLKKHGFTDKDIGALSGRDRAVAVAEGLIAFGKSVGAPTKLSDIKGFSEEHIGRILSAAKAPQLEMKLKNMPIPMTSADVDTYMAPIIRAAASGDTDLIINK